MCEYWGHYKKLFQLIKCLLTVLSPVPGSIFSGQLGEWGHCFGVSMDETSVKVCESKESLDIFQLAGSGPILDDFDLALVHLEALWAEHKTQEFYLSLVKGTFRGEGIKFVLSQSS